MTFTWPLVSPLTARVLRIGWGLLWRLLLPLTGVLVFQQLGNWLLDLRPDVLGPQPSLGDAIEAIFRMGAYYIFYLMVCAGVAALLALAWLLPRPWQPWLRGGLLLLGTGVLLFIAAEFEVLTYDETPVLIGGALLALALPLVVERLLARQAAH